MCAKFRVILPNSCRDVCTSKIMKNNAIYQRLLLCYLLTKEMIIVLSNKHCLYQFLCNSMQYNSRSDCYKNCGWTHSRVVTEHKLYQCCFSFLVLILHKNFLQILCNKRRNLAIQKSLIVKAEQQRQIMSKFNQNLMWLNTCQDVTK